jgi:hypothetical protein
VFIRGSFESHGRFEWDKNGGNGGAFSVSFLAACSGINMMRETQVLFSFNRFGASHGLRAIGQAERSLAPKRAIERAQQY